MTTLADLVDYWSERIPQDLSSFSDPGTTVQIEPLSGRSLRALWRMRNRDSEATFNISLDDGVSVLIEGDSLPYRSFIVGPEMADLKTVAQMILQSRQRQIYVETKAKLTSNPESVPKPATDILRELLESDPGDATRVTMLTGEAGAGKTEVLEEVVRNFASRYLKGQSNILLLYVNAQGRALARLNEALATELQDLRVSLTYHSVATLTRLGVLIPVIDGFDELLGVSGYDDAFSSLSGFLSLLKGEGQLLASARSVYYEEEFLSRAGNSSVTGEQRWSHESVRVEDWTQFERDEYTEKYLTLRAVPESTESETASRLNQLFTGANLELASKPLFVARTLDLILDDPHFTGTADLLHDLVNAMLERERKEKLLDRDEQPLLRRDQLRLLMTELAQEMWNQETRELDYRSVREVAEYVMASEGLPEGTQQIVVERMPTMAFLATSQAAGSVAFEHEVFFFYFFGRSLSHQYLLGSSDLKPILGRSMLPSEIADRAAIFIEAKIELTADTFNSILGKLSNASKSEWRRQTIVSENAGLVVAALLRRAPGELQELHLEGLTFPGGSFGNATLSLCQLVDVSFRRTDLSNCKILQSSGQRVNFFEPILNPSATRLEISGLDASKSFVGLRVQRDDGLSVVYEPSEVISVLRSCGVQGLEADQVPKRNIDEQAVSLMERLYRAFGKANPVCADDDTQRSLFGDQKWERIERLLRKNEVVTTERRSTRGNPKTFLRRKFLPEQIMAGLDPQANAPKQVRDFWRDLEQEFPGNN